jgi:hypothetical protein
MSISQSAVLMTSRLCSMTTMVLPASRSWCSTEQQVDVGKVQAGGGLVQDVERAAGVALGQLLRQLDALRLAARQRGGALAQADVGQAHVQQRLQLARNGRHVLEEGVRLPPSSPASGDVLALPLHFQRLAVVALAVADVAGHVDVGQKVHLHLDHAVALAGFAAAAATLKLKRPGP